MLPPFGHQRFRAARQRDERVGTDVERHAECFARRVHEMEIGRERLARGEGGAVHEEVESAERLDRPAAKSASICSSLVTSQGRISDGASERRRQLAHVLLEPLALVGQCELGARRGGFLRNRPRQRALVGDPEDEPLPACQIHGGRIRSRTRDCGRPPVPVARCQRPLLPRRGWFFATLLVAPDAGDVLSCRPVPAGAGPMKGDLPLDITPNGRVPRAPCGRKRRNLPGRAVAASCAVKVGIGRVGASPSTRGSVARINVRCTGPSSRPSSRSSRALGTVEGGWRVRQCGRCGGTRRRGLGRLAGAIPEDGPRRRGRSGSAPAAGRRAIPPAPVARAPRSSPCCARRAGTFPSLNGCSKSQVEQRVCLMVSSTWRR